MGGSVIFPPLRLMASLAIAVGGEFAEIALLVPGRAMMQINDNSGRHGTKSTTYPNHPNYVIGTFPDDVLQNSEMGVRL